MALRLRSILRYFRVLAACVVLGLVTAPAPAAAGQVDAAPWVVALRGVAAQAPRPGERQPAHRAPIRTRASGPMQRRRRVPKKDLLFPNSLRHSAIAVFHPVILIVSRNRSERFIVEVLETQGLPQIFLKIV